MINYQDLLRNLSSFGLCTGSLWQAHRLIWKFLCNFWCRFWLEWLLLAVFWDRSGGNMLIHSQWKCPGWISGKWWLLHGSFSRLIHTNFGLLSFYSMFQFILKWLQVTNDPFPRCSIWSFSTVSKIRALFKANPFLSDQSRCCGWYWRIWESFFKGASCEWPRLFGS